MGIFGKDTKSRDSGPTELDQLLSKQAENLKISITELKDLAKGKSCPKYGTSELLHARKVRGGKIVVFNISEKHRGEKISEGKLKSKTKMATDDISTDEAGKK